MVYKKIQYSDRFQTSYSYELSEPIGRHFDADFRPDLTPRDMLQLGVFGGAYFIGVDNLIPSDLPSSWFRAIQLSPDKEKHKEYNFFGTRASQSLQEWKNKGWIYKEDPHGWFQWYCRYYLGRRIADDARQIKRWYAMRRHVGQIKVHCRSGDIYCRPRQRQALLHWAYDSRTM